MRQTPVSEIARSARGGKIWIGRFDAELYLAQTPPDIHVELAAEKPAARLKGRPIRRLRIPMVDAPWLWQDRPVEVRRLVTLARHIASAFRAGQSVLITCHEGRNRSGLIAALALLELGKSPRDAVLLVRKQRGEDALSNRSFVKAIAAIGGRRVESEQARRVPEAPVIEDGFLPPGPGGDPVSDPGRDDRRGDGDWESKHARRRQLEAQPAQGPRGVYSGDRGAEKDPGLDELDRDSLDDGQISFEGLDDVPDPSVDSE